MLLSRREQTKLRDNFNALEGWFFPLSLSKNGQKKKEI